MGLTQKFNDSSKIELCGDICEAEIAGVKIFMNHFQEISEKIANTDDFDLCIFGHTHEYYQKKIGNCLLLNPGEIQGYKTGKVTFVVYDTKTKSAERVEVE